MSPRHDPPAPRPINGHHVPVRLYGHTQQAADIRKSATELAALIAAAQSDLARILKKA